MPSLENFFLQDQLLFYRLILLSLQGKDRLPVTDSDALELLKDFAEDVKLVRHLIGIGKGRPRQPVVIWSQSRVTLKTFILVFTGNLDRTCRSSEVLSVSAIRAILLVSRLLMIV